MPKVVRPKGLFQEGASLPYQKVQPNDDVTYNLRVYHPSQGTVNRRYQSVESRERQRKNYRARGIRTRRI